MTADINKTVIKGTPRQNSINPIDTYLTAIRLDLLPRAKNRPMGKQKIKAKNATIKVSESPPQALV